MAKSLKPKPETKAKNNTPEETEVVVLEKVEEISEDEQKMALETIKPTDLALLKDVDKRLAEYKEKYAGLTIVDENDAEGYENVRAALGVMRPDRTSLVAKKKSVTLPYRNTIAFLNMKFGQKINAIAEIEAPLKARKKEIDDIEERRKEEKRQAEEARLNNRINELLNNGMAFDGEFYSISNKELGIAEISIGVVDVRQMSDDLYKQFLQQVIDKNEKIKSETERIRLEKEKEENERKAQEEADRKKLAEEQEAIRKEREAMEKERQEMQAERDRIAKEKQEEIDRKQREENERIQKIKEARHSQLKGLGMEWKLERNEFWFEDISVSTKEIAEMDDANWSALMESVTEEVKKAKDHLARLEEEKKQEEQKRIADKAIADQKEKERQEQERRDAELAAANDKTKWKAVVDQLNAINIPDMKSPAYQRKANELKAFISNL